MASPSVEAGPLRPRDRPVESVAHDPRVDRPRDRARPRARLRSGVRGHLLRDLRPARVAPVRLFDHEHHRRPDRTEHGLATIGYDDEGVAAQSFDIVRDGVLVGYQLDRTIATEAASARSNGCAFATRLRVHSDPANGKRLARARERRCVDRGSHSRRRPRHLHRWRQELVDRHAAVQLPVHRPAVLPDRGRLDSTGQLQGRRVPGDDHRLLGFDGAPSAARAPTCSAARSTAARASRDRSAPVSHGCPSALFQGVRDSQHEDRGGS